mgnify:CR=1 FL=1
MEHLGGAPDLVMSDMAANTVGHKQTDHLRTMGLVETAADFAIQTLAPGGQALEQLRAIQPSARLAPIPDGWPAAPRLANWSRILSYLIYDEDA